MLNIMSTIRLGTAGDPQGDITRVKQGCQHMNTSNVDRIGFLGDIMGSEATIKATLQKLYDLISGNHDSGKYPHEIIPDFKGIQILKVGFDWRSFPWNNVNITKPTVMFSHCPVMPNCGTTDSLHKCGLSKANGGGGLYDQIQQYNVLVAYGGHTHTFKRDIVNNHLYVAEDSFSSQDRGNCHDGATTHYGYTRIDLYDDGTTKTQYARIDYTIPFVDPFPDSGPIPVKYKCSGTPDYTCIEDPTGPFLTMKECQAKCVNPPPIEDRYSCTGKPDFQCVKDANGPFKTLKECQTACKDVPPPPPPPPSTKKHYRCKCIYDKNGKYVDTVPEEDPNGCFDTLDGTKKQCDKIKKQKKHR